MEPGPEKKRSVLASVFAVLAAVGLAVAVSYALPASSPSSGIATKTVTLTSHPDNIIGDNISSDCLSSVPHALLLPGYKRGSDNVTVPMNGTNGNATVPADFVVTANGTVTLPAIESYANVTLTANGTTTIAGKTYWYVAFIPVFNSYMEDAYITFHGVLFFLSSVVQYQYSGRSQDWESTGNGTAVPVDFKISVNDATVLVAQTSSGSPCSYFLPSFTVEWGGNQANSIPSWENYNQAAIGTYDIGRNQTTVIDQETIGFPSTLPNPWFTQHVDPQAGVSYQTNGGEITLYVSTS